METQIDSADEDVSHFLKSAFKEILDSDALQEAIIANLPFEGRMERFDYILQLLSRICRDD